MATAQSFLTTFLVINMQQLLLLVVILVASSSADWIVAEFYEDFYCTVPIDYTTIDTEACHPVGWNDPFPFRKYECDEKHVTGYKCTDSNCEYCQQAKFLSSLEKCRVFASTEQGQSRIVHCLPEKPSTWTFTGVPKDRDDASSKNQYDFLTMIVYGDKECKGQGAGVRWPVGECIYMEEIGLYARADCNGLYGTVYFCADPKCTYCKGLDPLEAGRCRDGAMLECNDENEYTSSSSGTPDEAMNLLNDLLGVRERTSRRWDYS